MLFLLDLYIFHWTSEVVYPTYNPGIPNGLAPPGGGLLNSLHQSYFTGRWWLFMWSGSVMFGFGILCKNIGEIGIIRKKYFFLSSSYIVFGVSQLLRNELSTSFGTIGANFYSIIFYIFLVFSYLGLRAEPEQRKKRVKKEVKIKDSLFRITQRPEHISEEEITYYREQKICLVCKGKVAGFNIFLCPNCEALYHEDCARALTSMENVCWVCSETIDKTKPTKAFKKVEEKKDVEKKIEN